MNPHKFSATATLLNPNPQKLNMAESKPSWVNMKPAELERIVVDLAKKGTPLAKIGLILRDQHGVPKAKILSKKISQIIKEANIELKTDKKIIDSKIEKIKAHISKNKHDYPAHRSLTKNLWALHKIQKES